MVLPATTETVRSGWSVKLTIMSLPIALVIVAVAQDEVDAAGLLGDIQYPSWAIGVGSRRNEVEASQLFWIELSASALQVSCSR